MKEFAPNQVITRIIIFLFSLMFAVSGCGNEPQPQWLPPETTHNVITTVSLEPLWIQPNVFIEFPVDLGLAVSKNMAFLIGSLDIITGSRTYALDIFTGKTLWTTEHDVLFTLYADDDGLYVEESVGQGGNVTKYDPDTGKILWSRDFWDSGGIMHIFSYNDQLHLYLSPDKHKVLNPSTGRTQLSLFPEEPPFFDYGICGLRYQTPVYTDGLIFYRSNPSYLAGKVCAVDISTGNLRWKSDIEVISNVVAGDDAVFVLVESGELLSLDPLTGETVDAISVSFDNTPFTLYNAHSPVGSYYLAYDELNKILLVYLGDSRQLFAFEVKRK